MRLVGEYCPPIGPAPAKIVAPAALVLVFHFTLKTYVLPELTLYTTCTKAAFGEKVPAEPPLSFQATSWSAPPFTLTKMPRSWLNPALAVQRSALADSTAVEAVPGERPAMRLVGSIVCHAAPSLLARLYCWLLTAVARLPAGTS